MTCLELVFSNVSEPGLLKCLVLQIILNNGEGPARLPGPFDEDLAPLGHGALLVDTAVVALDNGRRLHRLEDPAGLEAPVSLFEKRVPVGDAPGEEADVHVVEGLRGKGPLLCAVIDLAAVS
jgi:hypothetical protein